MTLASCVDSTRIAAELGVRATPVEQALADTLAGYRIDSVVRPGYAPRH